MDVSQEIPPDMPATLYWALLIVFAMQSVIMRYLYRVSKRVDRLTRLMEDGGAGESSSSSRSSGSRRGSQRESRSSLSIGENAARRGTGSSGRTSKEEDLSRYDGSKRDETPGNESESEERSSAEQGRQFAEFLNEDPARMELTKKEQFEAFRRWRSQKGLNWRGS
ncbi:MAG: hypothetical protein JWO82_195 [Akkermansiaceae bacterium]|nr:hypothetical protein [Akkermansiaceae bacterium]